MKSTICLLLVLCFMIPVIAEEATRERSPEAIEILEKVDAAIKAVHAVSYNVSTLSTGFLAERQAPAHGESVLIGWNGSVAEKFYTHLETKLADTGEVIELTGGGDGDTYFLIDHSTKKGYEDMDPAVTGSSGRVLRGFGMIEFVHDRPYDDELNADVVRLEGGETIGGEDCYRVYIEYTGGQGITTWFFSKNDYLPRKRIRHISDPERGEGTIEIIISNLQVDPSLVARKFKMRLPEGYEQIDDFAP